jgi:hypothetical protein
MGKANYDEITIAEQAVAPGTPAAGFGHVYPKPDGKLYYKNSSGVETELTNVAGGGSSYSTITVTASAHNETATAGTKIILLNTSSNSITVNLPTAISNTAVFIIKKKSSANSCTIDCFASELIDGGATAVLNRLDESITIYSDNTSWIIT